MKQKVIDTIVKYNLIEKGDSIVIGLSGGADSVCLTLILNELKTEYNLSLKAVHINHCIRGDEADRDMRFCMDLCKSLQMPIKCYKIDVKSEAEKAKKGVEEYAREVRYSCFLKECNGGKIATAHNLDDKAETLIFNIARGCSVNGISSIPAKRDNIIRPLISVSRLEIEQYLKEKNRSFVTDSTNSSDEYTRNKIRHNVLPVLKAINPEFLKAAERLCESAAMQSEFMKNTAENLLENDEKTYKKADKNGIKTLENMPKAVLFEYISMFLKQNADISPDFFHIEKCVEAVKNKSRCQLPKGYLFEWKNGKPYVYKAQKIKSEEFEIPFKETAKTPYNNYNAKIVSYNEFKNLKNQYKNTKNVYNLLLNTAIDYDRICHSLILRNRRSGDRIFLENRKVNKLLKSVYNELKIPVEIRDKLAVLVENNKIIWAENVGVADGYSPNKNTQKVLLIQREVDYH